MSASTARRPLPALVFLLVLCVLTGIVWWRVLHRPDPATSSTPTPSPSISCTARGKAVTLPAPSTVSVVVLNGAGRDQLATQVTDQLKARGFHTGTPADAPGPLTGIGEIQYGKAGKNAAMLLGYYVPGAKLVPAARADAALQLTLGSAYHSLASQAAVNATIAKLKKTC